MTRLSYENVGVTEPEEGVIEFVILPEHLKLLRQLQLQWDDHDVGGLQTNTRRPYGSQNFLTDVQNAIDIEILLSHEGAIKLHRGAAMALQIALKTGKFKAATFRAPKFSQDWHEYMVKKPKKVKHEEPESPDPDETGSDPGGNVRLDL